MSTQDDATFFRVASYILGALTCLVVCLVTSANFLAPSSPPDPLAVAATMERIAPAGQSRMVATQPKPEPEPTIAAAKEVRPAAE